MIAGRQNMTSLADQQGKRTRYEPADVPSLIATLASRDGVERRVARGQLVSLGKPAVPGLIQCLSHPHKQIRWEAAKALGHIADPIAAAALVNALEDKDGDVRWLAAVALVALRRAALRPLLAALLERPDSDHLRQGAHHVCHDLARTRVCEVVRPVLEALGKPEPEMAVPAAAYDALNALHSL
jgi:HEAT repeat protein